MNVGSPRLLVAVCSLATFPHTVAFSPICALASTAEMDWALAGMRAIANSKRKRILEAFMLTSFKKIDSQA
jgi:hypothetical protein